MKIIAILLLLISAGLSFKHGWDAFKLPSPEQAQMMSDLGVTQAFMPYFGVFSILLGIMLFIPQTFVLSNILNAVVIVLIMGLSLNAGNYKTALIEIPFLVMPMLMIWLKYPLKF